MPQPWQGVVADILAVSGSLVIGLGARQVYGLAGALVFGLAGGLVCLGCFTAVTPVVADDGSAIDGAWHDSQRSFRMAGLVFGLVGGLVFGLVFGLAAGLAAGLAVGLDAGGWFVVLQSVKRRELQGGGYLPSDPARFLVWAADRGVLRQVGGGFQFRHLLLRDLLADEFEKPGRRPEGGPVS